MKVKPVNAGRVWIGKGRPVFIAGPCVIESKKVCEEICAFLKNLTRRLNAGYIFKASFDKANRTSLKSFRGPGLDEGLKILKGIKEKYSVPVLSDVHETCQVEKVKNVLDVIQIPAFLCRQTDLLLAAASTGKVINVKKGQFLSPQEIKFIIEKIRSKGNRKIIFTERGTFFGYNNLVVDFRSLKIMRDQGYPVVFDATHSVQRPAAGKTSSGGEREFALPLCRAAAAFGCDAFFLEVHPRPEKALSDGPNMIDFGTAEKLLKEVVNIWRAVKR